MNEFLHIGLFIMLCNLRNIDGINSIVLNEQMGDVFTITRMYMKVKSLV